MIVGLLLGLSLAVASLGQSSAPRAELLNPTNFLIDREGKLKATLAGGKTCEEFEAAIAPLLEGSLK